MKTLTRKQYSILEGIEHWRSNIAYTVERYGNNDPELPKYRKSLESLLDEADRYEVPWAAQNTALVHAENWRNVKSTYLYLVLEKRGFSVNWAF